MGPGVLPPCCHLSSPPAKPRYPTEDCTLETVSRTFLGKSLRRCVWAAHLPTAAPHLSSARPPVPLSPPRLSAWARLPGSPSPSIAAEGDPEGRRSRSAAGLPESRGVGKAGCCPRLGRSRPAAPLKGPRLRPRSSRPAFGPAPGRPAVRSGRRRPEAAGSSADPGGRERSGVSFLCVFNRGAGVRSEASPRSLRGWLLGGGGRGQGV